MSAPIDFTRADQWSFEAATADALEQLSDAWDRGEGAAAVRAARAEGYTVDAMRRELGVSASEIRAILDA